VGTVSHRTEQPDGDRVPLVRLLSMAVAVGLDSLHAELAAAGHPALRPVHGFALNAVSAGADTASALARALGMTKQGAAKIAAMLVGEGYAEFRTTPEDARRKPLVLTARGRSAVAASMAIQDEIERRWASVVGAEAMESLRTTLVAAVLAETGGALPSPRPAW
jgi:DNA-binding MarR family transcriptional regulator